jgi:hypothetical protein
MPRPRGYHLSQDAKDACGDASRAAWAERREAWAAGRGWVTAVAAFQAGDVEGGKLLYRRWLDQRHAELENVVRISNFSGQDCADMTAGASEVADALIAETQRLHAERAEAIARELRKGLS